MKTLPVSKSISFKTQVRTSPDFSRRLSEKETAELKKAEEDLAQNGTNDIITYCGVEQYGSNPSRNFRVTLSEPAKTPFNQTLARHTYRENFAYDDFKSAYEAARAEKDKKALAMQRLK